VSEDGNELVIINLKPRLARRGDKCDGDGVLSQKERLEVMSHNAVKIKKSERLAGLSLDLNYNSAAPIARMKSHRDRQTAELETCCQGGDLQ